MTQNPAYIRYYTTTHRQKVDVGFAYIHPYWNTPNPLLSQEPSDCIWMIPYPLPIMQARYQ